MIRFALSKCDFLSVLVCCSDREDISGEIRKQWIASTFEQVKNIVIKIFNYSEDEFPNTSEPSEEIAALWSAVFAREFPGYELLVTSERYGDFVASHLNINHILFDSPRKTFPVSASAIRKNVEANWSFLPDSVKRYYSLKVVLLGTESTGKSSLTEKLAQYYNCNYVLEAGRDIIKDSNSFQFEDLKSIAKVHAERIDRSVIGRSRLTIVDTDIHITMSYAQFAFNRKLDPSPEIINSNNASLYLYLNNDLQFVQDGTRLNESKRNLLDLSHRRTLDEHHIKFVEIGGDWEQRLFQSIKEIDKLIARCAKT